MFCGSIAPTSDPIVTARLVVRAPRPSDLRGLVATVDDVVRRANGWTPETERQLLGVVRLEGGVAGDVGTHVVCDRGGVVVGEASARRQDEGDAWELGWWIGPALRRQGYATELVTALVQRLHDLGVDDVVFGTTADNLAVQAIAAKVGAVATSTGPHRLPDGTEPESIWFRHRVTAGYVPPP
jgi:RimJ/RimL family protein N-acetyltransferase